MRKMKILVLLSGLAVVFASISFAKTKKPVSDDMLALSRINLEFKLDRTDVIRQESVPFVVKLTNDGNRPQELDEISQTTESLMFVLKGGGKKELRSSLKVPFVKTGGKIPKDVSDTFLLNPKQSREVTGDLLTLFGDIKPGKYRVAAVYKSRGGVDLRSKFLALSVQGSNPVYAWSHWEYDKVTDSNLKTVWINKGKTFRLFYTEHDSRNPEVIISSNAVYTFSGTREVKISAVNTYMQKNVHLLWRTGNTVFALRLDDSKPKGKPVRIKLPYKNFEVLNPSFTDKEGKLFVFLAVTEPKGSFSVVMAKVSEDGQSIDRIKMTSIKGRFGKSSKYSLLVDPNSNVLLAVDSGGQITHFMYDIVGEKLLYKVATISGIKDRIVDIQVARQYKREKGKDVNYIYYLTKLKGSRSDYTGYLFEVGGKEPKWYPTMNIYYPERLSIVQGVLDSYMRPYYLLSSRGVKRFFKSYFSIDLDQVLPPPKEPKALCTYPQLVVSSTLGEKYGVYLRYVKNRTHIAWTFLHEIAR